MRSRIRNLHFENDRRRPMSVKRHARKHRLRRKYRQPARAGRLGFDYQEARLIVRPELVKKPPDEAEP